MVPAWLIPTLLFLATTACTKRSANEDAPVNTKAWLEAHCAYAAHALRSFEGVTLPTADLPPARAATLEDAPTIVLKKGALSFDGAPVADWPAPDGLSARLAAARGLAKDPGLLVWLAADQDTPAADVARLVGALAAGDVKRLGVFGALADPPKPPMPPEPKRFNAIRQAVAAAENGPPDARVVALAGQMMLALHTCPDAAQVFATLAEGAPDQRCAHLVEALPPAFARCKDLAVPVDVFSVLAVSSALEGKPIGAQVFELNTARPAVTVKAGETWAALLPRLRAEAARGLHLPAPE